MRLDITAYRKLTKAINPAMEDGCPVDWENHFHAHEASIDFTEENWPGRSAGIERGAVYTFAESLGFRAGSYSGYNTWRSWLAAFAEEVMTDNDLTSEPFIELIHFADNEGVIGPAVAAKLANDFADNQERAETFNPGNVWWIEQYEHWRKAFEMAADAGAVEFH
jgi:hypothetical protein